jgi:hypothetical protein
LNRLKKIWRIVPGPAVLWAGQWFELFSRTHLTYPDFQAEAQATALLVGSFLAVIIGLSLGDASRRLLRILTGLSFLFTIISIIACWYMWFRLGKPMFPPDAKSLQDVWEGLSIIAMVMMVTTISLGCLLPTQESRTSLWIALLLFALVIVIIIAAVLWGR